MRTRHRLQLRDGLCHSSAHGSCLITAFLFYTFGDGNSCSLAAPRLLSESCGGGACSQFKSCKVSLSSTQLFVELICFDDWNDLWMERCPFSSRASGFTTSMHLATCNELRVCGGVSPKHPRLCSSCPLTMLGLSPWLDSRGAKHYRCGRSDPIVMQSTTCSDFPSDCFASLRVHH